MNKISNKLWMEKRRRKMRRMKRRILIKIDRLQIIMMSISLIMDKISKMMINTTMKMRMMKMMMGNKEI